MKIKPSLGGVLLLCVALPLLAHGSQDVSEAARVVFDAVAAAPDVDGQVQALVSLAWPREPGDPEVAAFAREELVRRGDDGMATMGRWLVGADAAQQAEIAETVIRAFSQVDSGIPPAYIPALQAAVWFGGRGAQEQAIPELARFRDQQSMLPMIDAAVADDELAPLVIVSLGRIGDDRARYWLEEQMLGGDPELRRLAAESLAAIGGRARLPLKAAMRSDDQALRETAAGALLRVAGVDDLTALHEYGYAFPDDDADLLTAIHERAVELERTLTDEAVLDPSAPMAD